MQKHLRQHQPVSFIIIFIFHKHLTHIKSFSFFNIATAQSTAGSTVSSEQTTTVSTPSTTTPKFCDEMEYINSLVATNSVRTKPVDLSNKEDLISKSVDFTNQQLTIIIDLPHGGAVVRDVKLPSSNVAQIEVTFTTVSNRTTSPIRGAPTSLPTNAFPTEKVTEIVVSIIKTSDGNAPQDVTLSVIACAEGSIITTTTSITEKTTSDSSQTSSVNLDATTSATKQSEASTTTTKVCDEMELVGILVSNNAISVTPAAISNINDLVREGVNFIETNPIFVIDIPEGGAVVHDVKLSSTNVLEIEVIFKTETGIELNPIQGAPTTLPKSDFPQEKVGEIIITVKKTTSNAPPQDVTLSIISCAETYVSTTLTSK